MHLFFIVKPNYNWTKGSYFTAKTAGACLTLPFTMESEPPLPSGTKHTIMKKTDGGNWQVVETQRFTVDNNGIKIVNFKIDDDPGIYEVSCSNGKSTGTARFELDMISSNTGGCTLE